MNASERRAGYLDDLGGLLRPLTALQRIEVIDGVRDRIDRAVADLGREPTGEDMEQILERVGSVESVATAALAAHAPAPAVAGTAGVTSSQPATRVEDKPAPRPVRNFDLSSIPAMDWPDEPAPRPAMTRRWLPFVVLVLIGIGSFFLLFLLPALALIVGAILLWMSPLWTTGEKAIGTAVPAIGLGAFLPLLALGAGSEGNAMLAMIGFVGAILGIAALIWVGVRGMRAARKVDQQHPAPRKKR
ncbi:hypothetical protein [Pseudactinotalea suaedae]|uniref:hypothetical protein n=1 Tax=Pseudactinotalea suaedae TaxID=1524924 RepID=UPI0012E28031|nr:hypothetical protein [Pseudactinotalea suaedae]